VISYVHGRRIGKETFFFLGKKKKAVARKQGLTQDFYIVIYIYLLL
jgi:hypothetical protein